MQLSPREEVQEIGRKGGQASHNSGFASMDPDKQVRGYSGYPSEWEFLLTHNCSAKLLQREARLRPAPLSLAVRRRERRGLRADMPGLALKMSHQRSELSFSD